MIHSFLECMRVSQATAVASSLGEYLHHVSPQCLIVILDAGRWTYKLCVFNDTETGTWQVQHITELCSEHWMA